MMMFKQLTDADKVKYQEWARENYTPFGVIEGIWHPVVQRECADINRRADAEARAQVEAELFAAGIVEDPDTDGGILG